VWFEDFSLHLEFVSPARAIRDEDILAYVRFSNDVRPVLNQQPGPLRVPDMYLFSLSVGLLLHGPAGYIPARFVAFFGFDTIRFHEAAWAGDVVHSSARVAGITDRGRNGVVTYEHEVVNGDGIRLVTSTQRILVERRDADG
jgi:hypothetical protein